MNLFHKNKNTSKSFSGGTLTASFVNEETGVSNDKCVICGKDTGVSKDIPVKERERYVSGSGQLCRECYFELYIKSDSYGNTSPNEYEMKRLLKMSRKE